MRDSTEHFQPTPWTDVHAARTSDTLRRRFAMARLAEAYWRPVFAFLVRRGVPTSEALDLTQGFFCEVVLDGRLIDRADASIGRFRSLLLTALRRYVGMEHRKRNRARRMPAGGIASIDAETLSMQLDDDGLSPEQAFARLWAETLIADVLADVQAGCVEDGMEAHWQVFRRLVVLPTMDGADRPSTADLARELGIATAERVSNMRVTVQRRFRATLRRHVRAQVGREELVDDEIRELMQILGKN